MLQNATNRYYDPEFWKLKISVHGGFESIFWNYQQLIKGYPYLEKLEINCELSIRIDHYTTKVLNLNGLLFINKNFLMGICTFLYVGIQN